MISLVLGTIMGWFLFIFASLFEKFKDLQKRVPTKITKKQAKRLDAALTHSITQTLTRIDKFNWVVDVCLMLSCYIVLKPIYAFVILLVSIYNFYNVHRDLGRFGIVTTAFSVVHPCIVFPLHMLSVYYTLKYPLQ